MPDPDALEAFIAAVESGKHDEAIARFYTDDASMQDNLGPLRQGRDNLIARERQFMTRFKDIRSQCVRPVFVAGDRVVIRWNFEFVRQDGSVWTMDELAYQRWEGNKVAEERFYYDPSQIKL
jgi:ketosteroid isomerase-like protein